MAMKGSTSAGGARETTLVRIVKGIWLSAISATKEDIRSMNATHRREVEIKNWVENTGNQQYRNGNHGNASQRSERPFNKGQGRVDGNQVEGSGMPRGGNQVRGMNAPLVGGREYAISSREADQATDLVTVRSPSIL